MVPGRAHQPGIQLSRQVGPALLVAAASRDELCLEVWAGSALTWSTQLLAILYLRHEHLHKLSGSGSLVIAWHVGGATCPWHVIPSG